MTTAGQCYGSHGHCYGSHGHCYYSYIADINHLKLMYCISVMKTYFCILYPYVSLWYANTYYHIKGALIYKQGSQHP